MALRRQFNDYQDLGNGAVQFSGDGGFGGTFFGPAAEAQKRRIDAMRNRGMLAQNSSVPDPNMSVLDAGGGVGGSAPSSGVPPMLARPTEQEEPQGPSPETLASMSPEAQAQAMGGKPIYQENGVTGYELPDGRTIEVVQAQRGSKGGFRETARTVKGGFERDEDYESALADASIERKLAAQERAETEKQVAQETLGVLEQTREGIKQQVAEESDYQTQVQQRVNEYQEKLAKAHEDYANSKVDPKRADRGLQDRIGIALGALGASLAKGPNYALEIFNRKIDSDIRAQEAEIQKKGRHADNMLNRLNQEMGSMKMSKAALRSLMLEDSRTAEQMVLQRARTPQAQAVARETIAKLDEERAEGQEQYRLAALGETTKQLKNVPGSAGRAAGIRLASLDKQKSTADLRGKGLSQTKTALETEKTARELEKGPEKSGAQSAIDKINFMSENLSKYTDPKSPQYIEPTKGVGTKIPSMASKFILTRKLAEAGDEFFGEGTGAEYFMDAKERQVEQDAALFDQAVTSMLSTGLEQGVLKEAEYDRAVKTMAGANTIEEKQRAARVIMGMMQTEGGK